MITASSTHIATMMTVALNMDRSEVQHTGSSYFHNMVLIPDSYSMRSWTPGLSSAAHSVPATKSGQGIPLLLPIEQFPLEQRDLPVLVEVSVLQVGILPVAYDQAFLGLGRNQINARFLQAPHVVPRLPGGGR